MATHFHSAVRGRRNGAARHAVRERIDEVMDDVTELRRDMGRLTDALAKAARGEADAVGARVEHLVHDAADRARGGATMLSENVRAHPIASLGAAAGIGALIGLMLAARR